jgi:hypothetical protein
MKRAFVLALVTSAFVPAFAGVAFADVPPPPVQAPEFDDSGSIPPPSNLPTSVQHEDSSVDNTPPESWYQDMHGAIYYGQQSTRDFKNWSYGKSSEIYKYAHKLDQYYDNYYWNAYGHDGRPTRYSWGYASRGDFNYGYYYYIRPIYVKVLYAAKAYYKSHYSNGYSYEYNTYYKPLIQKFVYQYHYLTKCNYGKNGNDPKAADDTEVQGLEAELGL